MIARALAIVLLLLLPTSAGAFEKWVWDPVPTATGYRLYWSNAVPGAYPPWTTCQMIETTLTETTFDPPAPPPNEIVFIIVTAFNAVGESGTGWAEGTTHGPITVCP
jgi:hypothetical protein